MNLWGKVLSTCSLQSRNEWTCTNSCTSRASSSLPLTAGAPREGRGGCPAAVCRRKCLHKFESDRKSFFNITLFFHRVYRGGKKTTYREFSVLSPTQKVGWRWQSFSQVTAKEGSALSTQELPVWGTFCWQVPWSTSLTFVYLQIRKTPAFWS